MRKMIISLAIATIAIVGLLLLLPVGRTAALTSTTDSLTDDGPYVKFEGPVEDRPAGTLLIPGDWRIGSITVTVNFSTTLDDEHGPPVLGAWVEVEGGQQSDGSVLAAKIETKRNPGEEEEFEFKGIIVDLPATVGYTGTWQVSGIRFAVDLLTTIKGTPVISAVAEVEAVRASDGTLTARKVEIEDRDKDGAEREWKGFIERLGNGPAPRHEGEWVVGGISVTVDADTELDHTSSFTLGDWAKVEAYEQPTGAFLADEIEIKDRSEHNEEDDDVKFYGIIQYITSFSGTWPITWEIGHRTVWLTGTTIVDESNGLAVIGAWAKVEANLVSDQLWAHKIEIEQAGEGEDYAEIEGLVTSLNPLIIAGQEIVTDAHTVIKGTPTLSITAEAKGRWVPTPTWHFLADRVEFEDDDHDGGTKYEIEGNIASLPADPNFNGTWVVTTTGGVTRSFEVTISTEREFEDGDPQVGCQVEAKTFLQDGFEVATEVEVEHCRLDDDGEYLEYEGFINQLGNGPAPRYEGEWVVEDTSFTVVSTTFIDMSEGTPAIGRRADVRASGDNDQWIASEIEIKSFGDDGLDLRPESSVAANESTINAGNVSNTSDHSRVPNLVVRANGDHHLVWEESNGHIYHSWKRKGDLWSLPVPISSGSRASLEEANGVLYLVWSDNDGTLNYEIYLAQWDDASESWSVPKNISHTSGQSISPDISADGAGNLHIAWADNTSGYWTIYHGTLNANAPVHSARGQGPHISVTDDGILHLIWQDTDQSGRFQVYHSRFDGADWSLPQDVSHSDFASTMPDIALDDDIPHLVWAEMQVDGAKDVYYANWSNQAWSSPIPLSNTPADSFLPEIGFGGGALHVAWTEAAAANTNPRLLYRKLSGVNWSAPQTLLSNGTGLSEVHLVVDASGKVHITWANYTSSGLVHSTWDWDIYYGDGYLLTNRIYLPMLVRH